MVVLVDEEVVDLVDLFGLILLTLLIHERHFERAEVVGLDTRLGRVVTQIDVLGGPELALLTLGTVQLPSPLSFRVCRCGPFALGRGGQGVGTVVEAFHAVLHHGGLEVFARLEFLLGEVVEVHVVEYIL